MIRFLGLENPSPSFRSFFHKEFWLHHYAIVIYCDWVMCFILWIFLIIWNHLHCMTVYNFFFFFRNLALPSHSHMGTDIPFVSWLLKRASCLEALLHGGYGPDRIANRTLFFFFSCSVQIIPPLIDLNQNRSKLKLYIGHLTALCHERDPHILQDLAPPSAYHHSQRDAWEEELQKMSLEEVGGGSRCLHWWLASRNVFHDFF